MLTINEQDNQVAEYLESIGVSYGTRYLGAVKNDDWNADKWAITFKTGKHMEPFEFNTGLGHRIKPLANRRALSAKDRAALKKLRDVVKQKDVALIANGDQWNPEFAVVPTQASVLYCLLSDASAGEQLFADFCADFGYDEDSRKAFGIYEACQKIALQLRHLFTGEQMEKLRELLEDY